MLTEKKIDSVENHIFSLSDKKDIKVGEKITVRYTTDLDIPNMHLIIRDIFSYHISQTSNTITKISNLKKLIEINKKSFLKCQELIKEKKALENRLDTFNTKGWEIYVQEIKPILDQYKKITSYRKPKKFLIGSTNNNCDNSEAIDENLFIRLEVIRKFLRIIDRYIEMDVIFYPPFEVGCPDCNLSINQMRIDEENSVYVCECNSIFGRVNTSEMPNIDPDKIDIGTKNSYDDKTNFIRRLKSYQGIQSRKIPKELLDSIDQHMQDKYGLLPACEINKLPADEYGRRGYPQASVRLLIETLRETGNSIHFQDINPICYELWGWICPSIEHLVPTILDDYTKTQEVYKRMNPNDSSINVELRLYWHLRIANHNCSLEDFKIPQSRDSRKRNSSVFKAICEEVGLEFYPII